MLLPTFLIIGANKAGTSSLHKYLGQHPNIFMTRVKEPMFFALEGKPMLPTWREHPFTRMATLELQDYGALFQDAQPTEQRGESSTAYLVSPDAPQNIRKYVPEAKLIAVLRDPTERAYSQFLMHRGMGFEPLTSFDKAVRLELKAIRTQTPTRLKFVQMGMYYPQLTRYYQTFPSEQLLVLLYDDFVTNPLAFIQQIFRFLEVDDSFEPNLSKHYNSSRERASIKHPTIQALATQPHSLKRIIKPLVPASLRERIRGMLGTRAKYESKPSRAARAALVEFYAPDIQRLEELIHRDLSPWRR